MSNDQFTAVEPIKTRFEQIPIEQIDDPQLAMRSNMANEDIGDLVASIQQVGIIEPIVVREVGDRFEVIAGHRRITAAEQAGLKVVPCHVATATEEQAEMMKIHENLYRVDVNPADEAKHYKNLIVRYKMSPFSIAKMTNRSETYVRDRLQTLDYPTPLLEALASKKIKLSIAKELFRIKDEHKLREMLYYAIGNGITTSVAKKWVDEQLTERETDPNIAGEPGGDSSALLHTEPTGQCFYCMAEILVSQAYTVYVHQACITDRKSQIQEPGESTPLPDQTSLVDEIT